MELAQTAKEPYNYFLLLRALFRSIGGGSHDLLYQEFLPLLPNLLQGQSNDFGCLLALCACLGLAACESWGSSSALSEGHGEVMVKVMHVPPRREGEVPILVVMSHSL